MNHFEKMICDDCLVTKCVNCKAFEAETNDDWCNNCFTIREDYYE